PIAARARVLGVRCAGHEVLRNATIVSTRVSESGADAVYYGGYAAFEAANLWKRVHAARPAALLVAGEDVDDPFLNRMGSGAAARTLVVEPTIAGPVYNAKARAFARRFRKRFGARPTHYALYGYAAMDAVLRAIAAASRDA